MANLSFDLSGRGQIQFKHPNGKRPTLRLGKVNKRLGESVLYRVHEIIAAIKTGQPVGSDTAAWISSLTPQFHDRLMRVGLVSRRVETDAAEAPANLDEFSKSYIDGRAKLRPNTVRNLQQSRRMLVEHFGKRRAIKEITVGDADGWREAMLARYSTVTVAREVKRARQFFKAAHRRGLIPANPFADLKGGSQANSSRGFFVTREMANAVLAACPDNEWRLIFALSRFGGLRCPSETLQLKWSDVNWETSRIVIRESKTKGRTIPLFPELHPYFEQAFEDAETGATYGIRRYRGAQCNLRTQLLRILARAGLSAWLAAGVPGGPRSTRPASYCGTCSRMRSGRLPTALWATSKNCTTTANSLTAAIPARGSSAVAVRLTRSTQGSGASAYHSSDEGGPSPRRRPRAPWAGRPLEESSNVQLVYYSERNKK